MANALGEYLGKEVVIENTAWAGLIPAVQTGKADIVISSMGITTPRKEQVDFSDPYSQIGIGIIINTNSPVRTLEDLNNSNVTIAVMYGTTPQLFADKYLTNATINKFNNSP